MAFALCSLLGRACFAASEGERFGVALAVHGTNQVLESGMGGDGHFNEPQEATLAAVRLSARYWVGRVVSLETGLGYELLWGRYYQNSRRLWDRDVNGFVRVPLRVLMLTSHELELAPELGYTYGVSLPQGWHTGDHLKISGPAVGALMRYSYWITGGFHMRTELGGRIDLLGFPNGVDYLKEGTSALRAAVTLGIGAEYRW